METLKPIYAIHSSVGPFFKEKKYPYYQGTPKKRYRTYIDLLIPEKSIDCIVTPQRIIVTLYNEFNHNNNKIGKQAVDNDIKLNMIATKHFACTYSFHLSKK